VVRHLKEQGTPEYLHSITEDDDGNGDDEGETPSPIAEEGSAPFTGTDDELYEHAVALVTRERKASVSFIQRCLQIGYNRSARLVDRMEAEGIVSSANHVGKREVLVSRGESYDREGG